MGASVVCFKQQPESLTGHEEQTRHRPRDVPHFYVDDRPEDDAISARERRERRTIDYGGIRRAFTRLHGAPQARLPE